MSFHRALLASVALALYALAGCKKARTEPEEPVRASPSDEPTSDNQVAWLTRIQVEDASIEIAPLAMHPFEEQILTTGKLELDERVIAHARAPSDGGRLHLAVGCGQRVKTGDLLASGDPPAHGDAAAIVTLQAPRDGEVLAIDGPSEVVGTQGCPLSEAGSTRALDVTVGERDPLWMSGTIQELDVPRVLKGAKVRLRINQGATPKAVESVIDWLGPALNPTTHALAFRAAVPNPDKTLLGGAFVAVDIVTASASALAIPRTSMLRDRGITFVFVRGTPSAGGKVPFRRAPIHLDETVAGEWMKVMDGLAAGDEVVVSGVAQLNSMFPR